MQSPSDVLKIKIIKEVCRELLHPDAYLGHCDGSDVGQRISAINALNELYCANGKINGQRLTMRLKLWADTSS